jgi:hypothetical protein
MSKNVIFTRRPDAQPLSNDEIYSLAPSVFAGDKASHLTERYGQITTSQAIGVLADFGYYPVQAAQVGKTRHAKHMLAFANHSPLVPTEGRPELILYNSHDGTSALKLFAGFFRFICSNGIVAGEGFKSRMLHNTSTVRNFETLITGTAARLDDLQGHIGDMRSRTVSQTDALEFIRHGATFRWKEDRITDNTISDIYNPRRVEDTRNDMWTIYNRLQEGLIRGGVRVGPENRKARAIGSIQQNLRINQELWDLATA